MRIILQFNPQYRGYQMIATSIVILVGGVIAGTIGTGNAIEGVSKISDAGELSNNTQIIYNNIQNNLKQKEKNAVKRMDDLGVLEVNTLKSLGEFLKYISEIQGMPENIPSCAQQSDIPKVDMEEIKNASVAADAMIEVIKSAALGTAAGVAATGATTALTATFGTASTGTAISTLSGAAANNAILAQLGGGAISAGGYGITAGTMVLTATSAGVALMVGGVLVNVAGQKLYDQADDAYSKVMDIKIKTREIEKYYSNIYEATGLLHRTIITTASLFDYHMRTLRKIVKIDKRVDWSEYSKHEKLIIENTVLLAKLLYKECGIKIELEDVDSNGNYKVNNKEIFDMTSQERRIETAIRQNTIA